MTEKQKSITYTINGTVAVKEKQKGGTIPRMVATARRNRIEIGSGEIDKNGKFSIKFEEQGQIKSPVEVRIGPLENFAGRSRCRKKKVMINPDQWVSRSPPFADITVEIDSPLLVCWQTRDIVISGVVCKELPIAGTTMTRCCPAPFSEVEVMDVDIISWMKPVPKPVISPIGTEKRSVIPLIAPATSAGPQVTYAMRKNPLLASLSDSLKKEGTISSTIVNSGCMTTNNIGFVIPVYASSSLGKVMTDSCGRFEITIPWPMGICNLYDAGPDIIFKVTQTVGGVTTTIYSEGYSQTRWDVPDYLFVKLDAPDDALVACNPNCDPFLNRQIFFEGVGNQHIDDHILQPGDTVTQDDIGYVFNGSLVKSPFGETLKIRAGAGTKIEEAGKRYYHIFYALVPPAAPLPYEPPAADWKSITEDLTDTCYWMENIAGSWQIQEKTVALGPQSLQAGGSVEYYAFRNLKDSNNNDVMWYDQNRIANFKTTGNSLLSIPPLSNGLYVLKIEVVNPDGTPDPDIQYGDDAGKKARMYLMVDNTGVTAAIHDVQSKGVSFNKTCGTLVHTVGDEVDFILDAYHPNKHLYWWTLRYSIGGGSATGVCNEDTTGETAGDWAGVLNGTEPWNNIDQEFPLDPSTTPPRHCSVYGVAVTLEVWDKITDGETLIGYYSLTPHHIVFPIGLAVSWKEKTNSGT